MENIISTWRDQRNHRKLLHKRGKVISWTVIHVGGKYFSRDVPYTIVLVEFYDKTRHIGQLVDCKAHKITYGMKVISILRRLYQPSNEGVITYGIKFKPM